MPCSGAETTAPPMAIEPDVGCSRPATQRSVVVLPQPDGPSRTTISPAAMRKFTSSTAAMPVLNTLRSRSTFSSADIIFLGYAVSMDVGGREGRPQVSAYCR